MLELFDLFVCFQDLAEEKVAVYIFKGGNIHVFLKNSPNPDMKAVMNIVFAKGLILEESARDVNGLPQKM